MNWKIGDKFVIDGPVDELAEYDLDEFKGKIYTVVEPLAQKVVFDPKDDTYARWVVKYKHMRPLTKLHKVML